MPDEQTVDENAGFTLLESQQPSCRLTFTTDTVLALILIFQAWLVQRSERIGRT